MAIPKSKTLVAFCTSAALLVMLAGFALPRSASRSVDSQQTAEQGKLVFEKYGCFVCHGNEGSGGVRNKNAATGGFVNALTYTSRAFKDADLKERIIRGPTPVKKADPHGSTPPLSMPYFRGAIPDAELNDLVAYLRSLTPEEGEEPKPVSKERPPVPDFMLGDNNCEICHSVVTEHFKTNPHYGADATRKGTSEVIVCSTCHGSGKIHAASYGDPQAIIQFSKE